VQQTLFSHSPAVNVSAFEVLKNYRCMLKIFNYF
jgi:hypothetical protein